SKDRHHQAGETEGSLDPLEPQEKNCRADCDRTQDEQQPLGPAGKQVQDDGNPAQFGGAGDQVQKVRGDQDGETKTASEAVANHREYWLFRNHGDATAHFHVNDDRGSSERDCPHELVSEERAGLSGKDDLAEINESAKRGHNAERDAEELFHSADLACSRPWRISSTRALVAESALLSPRCMRTFHSSSRSSLSWMRQR